MHAPQQLRLATLEAEPAQRRQVRPLLRRQHALGEAEIGERLHLGDALQRRLARVARLVGVTRRGHVAVREPGVVVGEADEAVEIGFDRGRERAHWNIPPGLTSWSKKLRSDSGNSTSVTAMP